MWQKMLQAGGGSGDAKINPTEIKNGILNVYETATVTIDSTKNYIVLGSANIAGNAFRQTTFACMKGTIVDINVGTGCLDNVAISGNTLSFRNAYGATYFVSYSVIEL